MTIKLRIEGDRILTDTGVCVGYVEEHDLGYDYYEFRFDACYTRHKTLPEAEAAYNAHLREVLGDRVVVPRADAEHYKALVGKRTASYKEADRD